MTVSRSASERALRDASARTVDTIWALRNSWSRSLSYSGRISRVGMTKISVTVEDELVEQVRDRVGARGLSAFVNQAVRHELQLARLGELLADLEDELGPPDDVMVAEALASLDRLESGQRSRTRARRPKP